MFHDTERVRNINLSNDSELCERENCMWAFFLRVERWKRKGMSKWDREGVEKLLSGKISQFYTRIWEVGNAKLIIIVASHDNDTFQNRCWLGGEVEIGFSCAWIIYFTPIKRGFYISAMSSSSLSSSARQVVYCRKSSLGTILMCLLTIFHSLSPIFILIYDDVKS